MGLIWSSTFGAFMFFHYTSLQKPSSYVLTLWWSVKSRGRRSLYPIYVALVSDTFWGIKIKYQHWALDYIIWTYNLDVCLPFGLFVLDYIIWADYNPKQTGPKGLFVSAYRLYNLDYNNLSRLWSVCICLVV
jgi:hypothetical protein